MWDGGLLNREAAAGLRARGSLRGLYAALRTVPHSGTSYVAPCPASYLSRAPLDGSHPCCAGATRATSRRFSGRC